MPGRVGVEQLAGNKVTFEVRAPDALQHHVAERIETRQWLLFATVENARVREYVVTVVENERRDSGCRVLLR